MTSKPDPCKVPPLPVVRPEDLSGIINVQDVRPRQPQAAMSDPRSPSEHLAEDAKEMLDEIRDFSSRVVARDGNTRTVLRGLIPRLERSERLARFVASPTEEQNTVMESAICAVVPALSAQQAGQIRHAVLSTLATLSVSDGGKHDR